MDSDTEEKIRLVSELKEGNLNEALKLAQNLEKKHSSSSSREDKVLLEMIE